MDITALWEWISSVGLFILIVIVSAWLIIFIINRIVLWSFERMIVKAADKMKVEKSKRMQTVRSLLHTITGIVILFAALAVILEKLDVSIAPLLATAGVAGVALGFGAQHLIKDIISGLFILIENQFNVGDVVKIAGLAGVVEKTNLRVTVLRDLEAKVHFVPNGEITTTTNFTKEWSRALLNIGVAYKEDTDKVVEVMEEVAKEMREDPKFESKILEDLHILGVDKFDDSSVNIKVFFKTQTMEQWAVGREFRRRLKKAFDSKGIEIPFPHRTVFIREK
jgi:small-conductance mechanosensitive channel